VEPLRRGGQWPPLHRKACLDLGNVIRKALLPATEVCELFGLAVHVLGKPRAHPLDGLVQFVQFAL
jgi:hypothetical protein